MKTLGGIVCVKDGNSLDYCWREAVASLLPVCNMISLCISAENDDDTEEMAREWMAREPRIVICMYPWPNPKGNPDFWVDWLQYAKEHARADYVFELDADEVLHENSYPIIEQLKQRDGRFSVWCSRLNFWRDAQTLIPPGKCVGDRVLRMMPKDVWMPSDGCHPKGAEATAMGRESGIGIFHYGFLRERKSFFRKARKLLGYFFNTWDDRMAAAEKDSRGLMMPGISGWENDLRPFQGTHPELAKPWLRNHGYDV